MPVRSAGTDATIARFWVRLSEEFEIKPAADIRALSRLAFGANQAG